MRTRAADFDDPDSMVRAGDPVNPMALLDEYRETEQVLAAEGVPVTVLRNNIYAEMLDLTMPLAQAVATGVLPAVDQGHVGYVTRDDCAAAAAAVLAGGGHQGQYLDITGPAAVDVAGIAEALGQATGRAVHHQSRTEAEAEAALRARLPEQVRAAPTALESAFAFSRAGRAGWFDVTTHAVERLTGTPATSLVDHFASRRDVLLGA
ncbi:Rossmann-fold NAD(P)-binding domain-containing protein [Goodfellowiella coeruleoviolacea]|uniref:NmrA-like domain-containing protein n=1 Tax=Goodfellowiella coeruleoviolacea TaxID=334858 RepID=A0AAE3KF25_9PSEU|nr:hypothetical protein [Goodfellowiella coeruleoviolacea]MCP2164497.1 hypothetical protein [Goodfellowiella coeruleoviolacea]